MVAYGNQFAGYGGYTDNSLMGVMKDEWKQLAQNGVQPDYASTKGQEANLGVSNDQQKQSWGQGTDAMGLMAAQANGAETPAMRQAKATQMYGQNAARALAVNAGGSQAVAAARSANNANAATAGSINANSNRALAANEQQNGMASYGAMADAMRGNANKQYGAENSFNYENANQQGQLRSANDQLMLGYEGMANTSDAAQMQQMLGNEQFSLNQSQTNYNNAMKGINMGVGGFTAGVGGAADAWGSGKGNDPNSYSDERVKANTQRAHNSGSLMGPFLDTLAESRATYRYKDPSYEPRSVPTGGRYAGVMAQDLERIPELGRQLVLDTPNGKQVDSKTALSALMAGVGDLHDRVRQLEGNRKHDDD